MKAWINNKKRHFEEKYKKKYEKIPGFHWKDTERHSGKWKWMTEIYLPPTCSLSGAKLISEGKSLTSGLCPVENMSNVDYNL